ncbi:hypothetical protein RNZ50_21945 [Paracoccaceae bacterium Fryx2]|nr:hypothetical protein [Paracoccaceae bacterium Fryx2]
MKKVFAIASAAALATAMSTSAYAQVAESGATGTSLPPQLASLVGGAGGLSVGVIIGIVVIGTLLIVTILNDDGTTTTTTTTALPS